jgi:hypothetical protein
MSWKVTLIHHLLSHLSCAAAPLLAELGEASYLPLLRSQYRTAMRKHADRREKRQ